MQDCGSNADEIFLTDIQSLRFSSSRYNVWLWPEQKAARQCCTAMRSVVWDEQQQNRHRWSFFFFLRGHKQQRTEIVWIVLEVSHLSVCGTNQPTGVRCQIGMGFFLLLFFFKKKKRKKRKHVLAFKYLKCEPGICLSDTSKSRPLLRQKLKWRKVLLCHQQFHEMSDCQMIFTVSAQCRLTVLRATFFRFSVMFQAFCFCSTGLFHMLDSICRVFFIAFIHIKMHLLLLDIKTVFSQKVPHISQSCAAAFIRISNLFFLSEIFFSSILYVLTAVSWKQQLAVLTAAPLALLTDWYLLLMGSKECANGFSETFDSFMRSHTQFIPDCSTFQKVRAKTCSCVNSPFVMSQ